METRTGKPSSSQFVLLGQRRFAPFFWTQFLGAFNDNLLKNALIVMVTYQLARFAAGSPGLAATESGVLVNVAASLLILPFVLFSASAGQIADKYDKAALIRYIKAFEIVVMAIAAWGFVTSNLGVLLVAVFLTGTQAALLGPIKYAILPSVLRETELVGGNALVESGTFIAILVGTLSGGYLASLEYGAAAAAWTCVALALAGFVASLFVPRTGAADPGLKLDWNPLRETLRNFAYIRSNRTVFLSILGISWFWLYGALFLSQLPDFAKSVLHGSEITV